MKQQSKQKQQEAQYDMFLTCSLSELEHWYNSYVTGYPRHVAPMIKALAVARGFDPSRWREFYV